MSLLRMAMPNLLKPLLGNGVLVRPRAQRSIKIGDFIDFVGKNSRAPKRVDLTNPGQPRSQAVLERGQTTQEERLLQAAVDVWRPGA